MMSMYVFALHSHLIDNAAFHGSNICIYIVMMMNLGICILDFLNEIDKVKREGKSQTERERERQQGMASPVL